MNVSQKTHAMLLTAVKPVGRLLETNMFFLLGETLP